MRVRPLFFAFTVVSLAACTSRDTVNNPLGMQPTAAQPAAAGAPQTSTATAGSNVPTASGAPGASATAGTSGAAGTSAAGMAGTPSTAGGTAGASTAGASSPVASAGGGGAAAGEGGAAAAGSGGAPTAGASGAAGAAGAPNPTAGFMECKSEDVGPCGTFTTQAGTKLQLGPSGVVMDRNVGKGFEATLASGDADGGASCASVVASFGEDPEESKPLLDTTGIDFELYTVYRPAQWVEGQKVPIITWGNGTCAKTEGYGALLRYVASHGFFVVAANSRWVGSGNRAMTRALDFAFAATADEKSPYYNRLDTTKVGAMGHSQGGMATITAARDSRISTVIIWNGGSTAVKPFLAVSGDKDIGSPTATSMKNALRGDPPGAFLFYHKTIGQGSVPGHLTLMTQPERVIEPTVAWFKYQLLKDQESSTWFVGASCKLCTKTDDYEYGQNGLQ